MLWWDWNARQQVALLAAMLGGGAKSSATYARAAALLGQMGLGDHLDAYPSEVSAGEQRRAVIARALINEPAVILADEPTSDLDEQTEIEIMDELLAVNRERGTTLILVTHNLALAEQAELEAQPQGDFDAFVAAYQASILALAV